MNVLRECETRAMRFKLRLAPTAIVLYARYMAKVRAALFQWGHDIHFININCMRYAFGYSQNCRIKKYTKYKHMMYLAGSRECFFLRGVGKHCGRELYAPPERLIIQCDYLCYTWCVSGWPIIVRRIAALDMLIYKYIYSIYKFHVPTVLLIHNWL